MKKKNLNYIDILGDLEDISKHLYLESPELWIEFSDKIADEVIDEMVLFYACKYDKANILEFVIENNILDLNAPSRNKSFSSIKMHLLAACIEFNSLNVNHYLTTNFSSTKQTSTVNQANNCSEKIDKKYQSNSSDYFPEFICQTCNKNIFEHGYNILEEVKYIYNAKAKKFEASSRITNQTILCGSCKNPLEDVTENLLQKIASINSCTKCGEDLTVIGIEQNIKMILNKDNKFVPSQKTYLCPCCKNELNSYQLDFFSIIE